MSSRMDQFREFVNKHPLLKEEVRNNNMTWQKIYEEWVIYGEDNPDWKKYVERAEAPKDADTKSTTTVNLDSIKSIMNYVQKLNPDTVNKTLNTVQKVIQIVQTVNGGAKTPAVGPIVNSMYSDWWD